MLVKQRACYEGDGTIRIIVLGKGQRKIGIGGETVLTKKHKLKK